MKEVASQKDQGSQVSARTPPTFNQAIQARTGPLEVARESLADVHITRVHIVTRCYT